MTLDYPGKFTITYKDEATKIGLSAGFHGELTRRYPGDALPYMAEISDCGCESCPARLVFAQLRQSLEAGLRSEAYYESKVVELLYLLGDGCRCKTELRSGDMRAVGAAKEIICSRIRDCPKIAELAHMTGTSASKLQGDFKAAYGATIHEYLWQARMAKALELMEETDAPLYAIALEVGCRKAGRFSAMFKKVYGMSPAEYRMASRG